MRFSSPSLGTSPALVPGLHYRAPLLSGVAGTEQTIKIMRQLVDDAVSDPQFIRFATDVVRSVAAFDDIGEVQAIYNWVSRNIRYTKDPVTKEKLYPPQELLKIRAGDCDDISMLLGALAIAIGYPARLITVGVNPQAPQEFSHVYVEAEAPAGSGNWIALDAARYGAQFGLEPASTFRKRAWSLVDDSYQDLSGSRSRAHRTKLSGLAGLGDDDTGDDGSGIDWQPIVQQALTETPQIMAIATGQPTRITTPGGGSSATGPYSSFATPYTPGYGVPTAGYGLNYPSSSASLGSLFSNPMMIMLALGAVVLLARRS